MSWPGIALAPQARMAIGAMLGAACLVVRPSALLGAVFALVTVLVWAGVCWPGLRLVGVTASASLLTLLPVGALAAYGAQKEGASSAAMAAAAWDIVGRGVSAVLVSVSTLRGLDESDFQEGVAALPMPEGVRMLLVQMVHQTRTLVDEVRSMSAALALRGAAGERRLGLRFLIALPSVWLPRVILRAERVAAVMELRGYDRLPRMRPVRMRPLDWTALLAAVLWSSAMIAVRVAGRP